MSLGTSTPAAAAPSLAHGGEDGLPAPQGPWRPPRSRAARCRKGSAATRASGRHGADGGGDRSLRPDHHGDGGEGRGQVAVELVGGGHGRRDPEVDEARRARGRRPRSSRVESAPWAMPRRQGAQLAEDVVERRVVETGPSGAGARVGRAPARPGRRARRRMHRARRRRRSSGRDIGRRSSAERAARLAGGSRAAHRGPVRPGRRPAPRGPGPRPVSAIRVRYASCSTCWRRVRARVGPESR